MTSAPNHKHGVAEQRCAFCGDTSGRGLISTTRPPQITICGPCRVRSRALLEEDLLGTVACSFCSRLHPAGGMTALAASALQPEIAICNECLDWCTEFDPEDRVHRGLRDAEAGSGTILLGGPDLPRDKFGHPWQALFYFDEQSRPTRLVTDDDGQPLGYRNKPDGSPYSHPDKYVALPEPVAIAAQRALEDASRRS